jgi:16S rRNA processing protein RimM
VPGVGVDEAVSDLEAGRIGRAHGLDGSFYVTRPRPRLLTVGTVVFLAGRSAPIVRRAGTDERPIVRLEGIEDRSAAEALKGLVLSVEQAAAPELLDGEWWAHELEGCQVVGGGAPFGTVVRMLELPSCEVLEVEPSSGGAPVLVPMVKDAVRHVDVERRVIDIDLDFLDLGGTRGT